MLRFTAVFVMVSLVSIACNTLRDLGLMIYKPKLTISEVIAEKEKIDKSDNPAYKHIVSQQLRDNRVKLENVLVKDVIPSGNIDYSFCVIVAVPYEKGEVECYLYTREGFGFYGIYEREDIETVSELVKGKTRINAVGDFERFFSLLDEAYIRIEIVKVKIKIVEEEK